MKKVFIFMSLVFASLSFAGDVESGKAKSAMCASCHGADGNSVNPVWPTIAGQHENYISRQLSLFKSGERKATVMAGMVAALNEEDMKDLAAYFNAQKAAKKAAEPELVALGQSIFQGGKSELNIPACMSCHGVAGEGNPLSGYPIVAGQHAAYNEQRLKDFRAGETVKNADDVNGNIMASVAKYLSDDEIKAVASYMQGLSSK
ncbi:MAG: c-type cytochrome [Gammaproteobacteria bacterium]|nr:cytochrome c4 [Xanthomonadales bacterium]